MVEAQAAASQDVVIPGAARFLVFRGFTDSRSPCRSPARSRGRGGTGPGFASIARFGGFARYGGRSQDRVSYFRKHGLVARPGRAWPRNHDDSQESARFARNAPESQGSPGRFEGCAIVRSCALGRRWARLPRGSRERLRGSYVRKDLRSRRKVVWPQGFGRKTMWSQDHSDGSGSELSGVGRKIGAGALEKPKSRKAAGERSIPQVSRKTRRRVPRARRTMSRFVRHRMPSQDWPAKKTLPINRRLRASSAPFRKKGADSRSLCRDRRGRSSTFTGSRGRGHTGRKTGSAG
jgi:hypothetical protein